MEGPLSPYKFEEEECRKRRWKEEEERESLSRLNPASAATPDLIIKLF